MDVDLDSHDEVGELERTPLVINGTANSFEYDDQLGVLKKYLKIHPLRVVEDEESEANA
jgi:hypothetical protein